MRGLDALTINDRGRGMLMTALLLPELGAQSVVQALPSTTQLPLAKVAVDRLPIREIMRQGTPFTTVVLAIEDRVNDSPHISGAMAATRLWRRNQGFDIVLLLVGQIGWVVFVFHTQNLSDQIDKLNLSTYVSLTQERDFENA